MKQKNLFISLFPFSLLALVVEALMKDSLGGGRRSPPKPHGGGVGVLSVKDGRGSRSSGHDIGLPRGIGRRFYSISKGSNSNMDCPMVDNQDPASMVGDGGFRRDGILGVGRQSSVSLEGVDGGSLVAEDDVPSPKCNRFAQPTTMIMVLRAPWVSPPCKRKIWVYMMIVGVLKDLLNFFPSLAMTTRSSNAMALETAATQERSVSFLMEDKGLERRAADGSSRERSPSNVVGVGASLGIMASLLVAMLGQARYLGGFSISWRLSRSYWWGMVMFGGLTLATTALF